MSSPELVAAPPSVPGAQSPEQGGAGPVAPGGGRRYLTVLVLAWCVLIVGASLWTSTHRVASLASAARTLGLAALCLWGLSFTGWRCLRRLWERHTALDPLEATLYELGAGAGVAMAALFAASALGALHSWTATAVLVGLCVGDPRRFVLELRARRRRLGGGSRLLVLVLVAVGAMTFLESLAPATSQDALVYHLAVPDIYIREGGFVHVPGNFFASFPQNVEMLFTLALLLDDSSLANVFHWILGAGCVAAVAALARRLGGGGLTAAAMFATVPTVALISSWAYVDLGAAFFQILALLAFLRWWQRHGGVWLALAAVATGLAAGCKYTGGSVGVLLGIAIFFEGAVAKRQFPTSLGFFARYAALALAVASPWYVKNLVYTGNPLYPFLYSVFGGSDWDVERAALLSRFLGEWGGSEGLLDLLLLPLRLTFTAEMFSIERFDGLIGPAFLLAVPLLALAVRRGSAPRLVLGVTLGFVVAWLVMTRQIRFLLPALACVSALTGAMHALQTDRLQRRVVAAALAACFVLNALVITTHFAAHDPLPVVLGFEPESSYLAREIPGGDYEVFDHISRELPEGAHVLFGAAGNPGFLCKRPYTSDAIFENRTLGHILERAEKPRDILDEFRRRGFTHLLFRSELVLDPSGRRSDIPLERQLLLVDFLNGHAVLERQASGTQLWRIESDGSGGGGIEGGSP